MSSPDTTPLDRAMLLCLDVQPVFIEAIANGKDVLKRCQFAVEAAQGFGLPVFFTEQVPAKLGHTHASLLKKAPKAKVAAKEDFSAFAAEALQKELAKRGTEHLLICGLETPICVYQTALAALEADLQVTLLSDALGARRPDDAATVLTFLQKLGCHILPSETVFYALLGSARHSFFKPYTTLVKTYA